MKLPLIATLTISASLAFGQIPSADASAVMLLDRMSSVIGELESCSFTLESSNDVEEYPYGLVKRFIHSEVCMVGPDKMWVQSRGSEGHKGYWYNGTRLFYYSYSENNYVALDAPSGILAMIDTMNSQYDMQFPAADFFYPTFTDDVLENFEHLDMMGQVWVNGKECFHLRMENAEMLAQLWISDDAYTLPVKMSIQYKSKPGAPQYEATFSDWKINPLIPSTIFEFSPPEGATQLAILKTNSKE